MHGFREGMSSRILFPFFCSLCSAYWFLMQMFGSQCFRYPKFSLAFGQGRGILCKCPLCAHYFSCHTDWIPSRRCFREERSTLLAHGFGGISQSRWRRSNSSSAHTQAAKKKRGKDRVRTQPLINFLKGPRLLLVLPSFSASEGLVHCLDQSPQDIISFQWLEPPAADQVFTTWAFSLQDPSHPHRVAALVYSSAIQSELITRQPCL